MGFTQNLGLTGSRQLQGASQLQNKMDMPQSVKNINSNGLNASQAMARAVKSNDPDKQSIRNQKDVIIRKNSQKNLSSHGASNRPQS